MSQTNKYDAPKVVLHHVENILEGLRESFFFVEEENKNYDLGEKQKTKVRLGQGRV